MPYTPKPHVSKALRHLRFGVTVSGAALSLALVLQLLVFAFVHFTDARWTELEPPKQNTRELRVVRSNTDTAKSLSGAGSKVADKAPAAEAEAAPTQTAQVNRVLNRNDVWMHGASDLARTVGSLAVIVLAIAMFQAVVVAGGASVPGVERVVTAGSWSFVLALVCLPVAGMLPGVPFAGALPSYEWLTTSSEAIREGSPIRPSWGEFYGSALLVPMIAIAVTGLLVLRFHLGVEQGVIATNVSELDEKLHREMSSIKLGATSAPRSVGALNRAIGEATPVGGAPAPAPEPALASASESPLRRITEPTSGDGLKRPI